jgi:hypothetical protein
MQLFRCSMSPHCPYQHASSSPTHDTSIHTTVIDHMIGTANRVADDNVVDDQQDDDDNFSRRQTHSSLPSTPTRLYPWGKFIFGLSLLAIILYVIIDSLTAKRITSGFQSFLTWMETNLIAGIFAFTFVYFAATVLFVPGSILTLGSGFVFGTLMGLGPGVALASGVVLVGASLGAIVR